MEMCLYSYLCGFLGFYTLFRNNTENEQISHDWFTSEKLDMVLYFIA